MPRVPYTRVGERERPWVEEGSHRIPEADLLVITHEEIPGLLPARTTSFRAVPPKTRDAVQIGEAIRFSLRGTLEEAVIVAIARW